MEGTQRQTEKLLRTDTVSGLYLRCDHNLLHLPARISVPLLVVVRDSVVIFGSLSPSVSAPSFLLLMAFFRPVHPLSFHITPHSPSLTLWQTLLFSPSSFTFFTLLVD